MSAAEILQQWAWLIAVALAVGLGGLLLTIRRAQAYQARKRALAAARADKDAPSDAHAVFLRKRRYFFMLLAFVVSFFLSAQVWTLYSGLEP